MNPRWKYHEECLQLPSTHSLNTAPLPRIASPYQLRLLRSVLTCLTTLISHSSITKFSLNFQIFVKFPPEHHCWHCYKLQPSLEVFKVIPIIYHYDNLCNVLPVYTAILESLVADQSFGALKS